MSLRRRVKNIIFERFLEKNPKLLRVTRQVQFALWRGRVNLGSFAKASTDGVDEILWVDPNSIKRYVGNLPWNRFAMRARSADGDWDLAARRFEGWDLYKAIRERFLDGQPWDNSKFYKRVINEIEQGAVKWGCSTKGDFDQRLLRIEKLFDEIERYGFKTQQELSSVPDVHSWESNNPFTQYDEVTVCIDRNGRFLLRDGKHRLSIAKILGLQRIPIVVGLRHKQWEAFRKEIREWVESRGGVAYQPFTHPDLQDIPAQHDDKRFELMSEYLTFTSGMLLDIGTFFGYFCHRFEDLGFTCTAIENHPRHIYFARRLRDAEERNFVLLEKSICDVQDSLQYDVVLALNIFHHFLKTPASFDALSELLERIETKVMFFEPHCQDDHVMRNAHVNFAPSEFVKFILDKSSLNRAVRLGIVARGRELYALTR